MKRVGDVVKLRALTWDGPAPRPGDMLKTATGREYLITRTTLDARASEYSAFSIFAVVMPSRLPAAELPPGCRLFRWTWARRLRRARLPGAVGAPRVFGRRVR